MKRGRKPAPSVTFYMRSSEYGDVKILFSYNWERYSGGTTYISLRRDAFDKLKPNGEPKDACDENNPKVTNGIPVSDLLVFLRQYIVGRVEECIRYGKVVDEAYIKELCSVAAKAMFEQLQVWSSNLEWNRCMYKAMQKGREALSEFYRANLGNMFTSLDINREGVDDGKQG